VSPVFAWYVPAATAPKRPRHQTALFTETIPSCTSSSPEVSAAENQSREVEGQTCPSTASAKAPEIISKGGSTIDEARGQLAKFGPNAMPDIGVHPLAMAIEKFWAPVPYQRHANCRLTNRRASGAANIRASSSSGSSPTTVLTVR
jgi:hypothetical protein